MSRRNPSGSPEAWQLRRKAYRQTANQVSNPGQPSSVNRKARRYARVVREYEARAGERLSTLMGGSDES